MPMAVVQIRQVRVAMGQRFMSMPVSMRRRSRIHIVPVLVMRVVNVAMIVTLHFMLMQV